MSARKATAKAMGIDLLNGNIMHILVVFAILIVFFSLTRQLYSIVDLVIVGRYMGSVWDDWRIHRRRGVGSYDAHRHCLCHGGPDLYYPARRCGQEGADEGDGQYAAYTHICDSFWVSWCDAVWLPADLAVLIAPLRPSGRFRYT